MDLASGKFTAPRPGIYFFSFAGDVQFDSSSSAGFLSSLYLNGNLIGSTWVNEKKGPVDQNNPFTLQSTLSLKKGDQLWLTIRSNTHDSFIVDSIDHHTHFTGFMLEEEVAASL